MSDSDSTESEANNDYDRIYGIIKLAAAVKNQELISGSYTRRD